jgi:hypothetical protein
MIMTRHGNASTREHESLAVSLTNQNTDIGSDTVGNALELEWARAVQECEWGDVSQITYVIDANLKRRARLLAVDGWVDDQSRKMICCALEARHPYLGLLVRYPRWRVQS